MGAVFRAVSGFPLSLGLWRRAADGRAALARGGCVWVLVLAAVLAYGAWQVVSFVATELSWHDVGVAFVLGLCTLARVVVLMVLASLIWVPIGVWVGLRPDWARRVQPVAQFLAAFPANLLFPPFVVVIVYFHLNAGHLADAADGAGHPVVHPVQRHRRRHRLPGRPEARRRRISASAAGCGGAR